MSLPHLWQREALIATARRLNPSGLNQGTSGNLSHRVDEGFLVTPTGMEYEALRPEDIVLMRFDGSTDGALRSAIDRLLSAGVAQNK